MQRAARPLVSELRPFSVQERLHESARLVGLIGALEIAYARLDCIVQRFCVPPAY